MRTKKRLPSLCVNSNLPKGAEKSVPAERKNSAWDLVIENLRSSAVFNSSLGSKELFHSNLIGYFLQQGDSDNAVLQSLSQTLAQWLRPQKEGSSKTKFRVLSVFREFNHFDLFIALIDEAHYNELKADGAGYELLELLRTSAAPVSVKSDEQFQKSLAILKENCKFVVVENKFKSIPDAAQLNEYSEKVRKGIGYITGARKYNVKAEDLNTTFYLLLPHYSLNVFGDLPEPWLAATYEDFSNKMLFCVQMNRKNKDDFMTQYVKSYGKIVHDIMLLTRRKIQDPIEEGAVFPDAIFSAKLDTIRLQDFYEKLWFSALARKMSVACPELDNVRIVPECGYGHNAGLMGYKCYLQDGSDIVYGIQIQNGQFRYYVEPAPDKKCGWAHFNEIKFRDALNDAKYESLDQTNFAGIDDGCIVAEMENVRPTKMMLGDEVLVESKENPQDLKSFGNFKYVYVILSNTVTQKKLSDLIKISLSALDKMVRQNKKLFKIDFNK